VVASLGSQTAESPNGPIVFSLGGPLGVVQIYDGVSGGLERELTPYGPFINGIFVGGN